MLAGGEYLSIYAACHYFDFEWSLSWCWVFIWCLIDNLICPSQQRHQGIQISFVIWALFTILPLASVNPIVEFISLTGCLYKYFGSKSLLTCRLAHKKMISSG